MTNIPDEQRAREALDLIKKVLTKPDVTHAFQPDKGQLNVQGVGITEI